jgi:hypothetical protein
MSDDNVRNRRWLGPAAIAAAVIVITAGIAIGVSVGRGNTSGGSSSASGPVVPWSDAGAESVPFQYEDLVRPVGAPEGMRACGTADLRLESTQSSHDTDGMITTDYILRSIASSSCAIENLYMSAALVDASGVALQDDGPFPAGPAPIPSTLLVRPGQLIVGDVTWGWLGGTTRPARLAFLAGDDPATPPDLRLSASLPRFEPTGRPAGMTDDPGWHAGWNAWVTGVHDAGSFDSLVPTLHVPSTVVEGNALRYTVALENDTDTPVRLTACPDVVQSLGNPPKFIDGSAIRTPLNCAAAPSAIGGHSSVTFAFEIDTSAVAVPSDYTAHPNAVLRWYLVDGSQTLLYGQAALTVTR